MHDVPSLNAASLSMDEIDQVVKRHAAQQPDAFAILAGEREPLTYEGLARLLDAISGQLRNLGVGPDDRVAIVLPNGPEMATCFLCVAAVATAAPLNLAYRRSEFDFYLADLRAKALIVQRGVESPSRDAASAYGIPIFELQPSAECAGVFALSAPVACSPSNNDADVRQSAALVLHTSGTTARPKLVPLTHANLAMSARNIVQSLQLTQADRCLNIMPMFHIHGLVGALLSSLHAGGSVICEGAFHAGRCLDILEQQRPTWYTAAPTMHQAILAAATRSGRTPAHSLRFIRSCSSALPPTIMSKLENAFQAPVVEAYGMTEAAHQMTCNPLPPQRRKPGSVGQPAGVAVAIMDSAGALLPLGAEGEVVIQGANVTAGYEDNPQANFSAFENGWFRTGDQGRMDDEGYLFLTGRLKELINRGGEKISPREIDEALLTHPDVAQAMAFALPHPTLGEDVAAAVVPKEGRALDPADVRRHVAAILAEFKTPQRLVVVDEIPKGPTGKPQRIGLAEKLGLVGGVPAQAALPDQPPSETERVLAEIWAQLLETRDFQRTESFFASGGDSLSATMLMASVEERFRVVLPIRALFESGTLGQLAALIDQLPKINSLQARRFTSLVPFQTAGATPPFFMVHGHSGRSLGLGLIAPHLNADQPFYGFVARGMDGKRLPHRTIAAMAADYVTEVREVQPHGPYYLGGFCAGGTVAYEMAQRLIAAGESVAALVLLDTAHPRLFARPPRWLHAARTAKLYARRALMWAVLAWGRSTSIKRGERIVNETLRRGATFYHAKPYPGRLTLIRSETHHRSADPHMGWLGATAGGVDLRRVPGDHAYILTPDQIGPAAREIQACLRDASERETSRLNVEQPPCLLPSSQASGTQQRRYRISA
jgi:acyl-CoA synthetase (AMP-forming)/AMP-acid ligase II/thioesterase domain-containing protein/acyl carrier protein